MAHSAFAVTDCAMLSIATGVSAQNLRELRDRLNEVHPSSIYYHFWGHHLRPGFEEPEFNNDFANWAFNGLNDLRLAERLSIIDMPDYLDLEALRAELIEVIEERLYESEHVPWSKADQSFQFIRSILVIFDTGIGINHPQDMATRIPEMSLSSLYYHFFDARRRPPVGIDDFRAWLEAFGDSFQPVIDELANIDPQMTTLPRLRQSLLELFSHLPEEKRA